MALATALLAGLAGSGMAQQSAWDPRRVQVTRTDLTTLLDRLDKAAASKAYSDTLRARARAQGSLIRARLQDGDFQAGDRIALSVEGETTLSDTFTVATGQQLPIPQLGDIPLSGVLRSELESHVKTHMGRFIRDPKVTVRSLIRVAVMGGVGSPGFYSVPSEALLSDVIMIAGGPAVTAKLSVIQVIRGERRIWEGDALVDTTATGRSLDQIGVRAGDRINVPESGGGVAGGIGGRGGYGLGGGGTGGLGFLSRYGWFFAVPLTVLSLVRLF
jgi:protein involved in polysaccharide export with SLBB domain